MYKKKSLLQKAKDRKPTKEGERKALNQLSKKDPDKYFRQKQSQITEDIQNAKNKRKSKKSTKSTKSTKSKSNSRKSKK